MTSVETVIKRCDVCRATLWPTVLVVRWVPPAGALPEYHEGTASIVRRQIGFTSDVTTSSFDRHTLSLAILQWYWGQAKCRSTLTPERQIMGLHKLYSLYPLDVHKDINVGVYVSAVFVALLVDKVHWQAVQSDEGADNSGLVS